MSDRPVQVTAFGAEKAIRLAQETFDIEAAAILGLKPRLGDSFTSAVKMAVASLDARGFKAQDFARSPSGGALGRRPRVSVGGDLRRLVEKGAERRSLTAMQVMHATPHAIQAHALAADATRLMERHRITSVLVVDDNGELCGALNSNDLMRAKVI